MMTLLLVLCAAVAWSTPQFDDELLADMVAELLPQVEALAGRPFVRRPRAKQILRREFRDVFVTEPPDLWSEEHEPDERTLSAAEVRALSSTVGVYARHFGGIRLIRESMVEVQKQAELSDRELVEYVRCTLVHELVHALQDQYARTPPPGQAAEQWWGSRALREGHASVVERQWCQRNASPAVGIVSGRARDMVSSMRGDDLQVVYAVGEVLVEALNARSPELIWAALAHPPAPTAEEIVRATTPARMPGWHDPIGQGRIVVPLFSFGRRTEVSIDAMELFRNALHIDVTPRATAGRAEIATGPYGAYSIVAAMVLEEGTPAGELVQRRLEQVRALHGKGELQTVSSHAVVGKRIKITELDIPGGGPEDPEAISITFKTGRPLHREVWIYGNRVLAVIATNLGRGSRRDWDAIAWGVWRQLPDVTPTEGADLSELQSWLARVERRAPPTTITTEFRRHWASSARRDGSRTACRDAFDVSGWASSEPPTERVEDALFCAAQSREGAVAETAMQGLGSAHQLRRSTAAAIGEGFLAGRRYAWALWAHDHAISGTGSEERLADLRLRALVHLERWTEAHEQWRRDEGTSDAQAWAAGRLSEHGFAVAP